MRGKQARARGASRSRGLHVRVRALRMPVLALFERLVKLFKSSGVGFISKDIIFHRAWE